MAERKSKNRNERNLSPNTEQLSQNFRAEPMDRDFKCVFETEKTADLEQVLL